MFLLVTDTGLQVTPPLVVAYMPVKKPPTQPTLASRKPIPRSPPPFPTGFPVATICTSQCSPPSIDSNTERQVSPPSVVLRIVAVPCPAVVDLDMPPMKPTSLSRKLTSTSPCASAPRSRYRQVLP